MEEIVVPAGADFHVHLRQGEMMRTVVPLIRQGGINTVYVMPNLNPPIITVEQALQYRAQLQELEPRVTFLMSLYLTEKLSVEEIRKAKENGIIGVKSYPRGVTTNSQYGVSGYEQYYPVLSAMQEYDLVLNLHGEDPTSSILDAEAEFLPILRDLHRRFPRLRIVLEHCTTGASIQTILECDDNVVGTITPHHLFLTTKDWIDNPFSYCKPVAKTINDRDALIKIVTSGNKKFFLGSDSAPHYKDKKIVAKKEDVVAGVFTQPFVLQLVVEVFSKKGKLDLIEGFTSTFGRNFYKLEETTERVLLKSRGTLIPECYHGLEGQIVPFKSRERINWEVNWI